MGVYTIKRKEIQMGCSSDSKKHRLNGSPPTKEIDDLPLPGRKE